MVMPLLDSPHNPEVHPPFRHSDPTESEPESVLIPSRIQTLDLSFFGKSLFFSLLAHLVVAGALLLCSHSPSQRPYSAVPHWMVRLVTEWNAESIGIPGGETSPTNLSLREEGKEVQIQDPFPILPTETPFSPRATGDREEFPVSIPPNPSHPIPKDSAAAVQSASPLWESDDGFPKILQDSLSRGTQPKSFTFNLQVPPLPAGFQLRYFQRHATFYLENALPAAFSLDERMALQGKEAEATISFLEQDGSPQISIRPESDPMLSVFLLEKVDWEAVNPRGRYSLPNQTIRVKVSVNETGHFIARVSLL
jgi:hypothetical protein